MTYPRQFALPFLHDSKYQAGDFLRSDGNAEALAWIARPAMWPDARLAVVGEAGAGKTHLLHVFSAIRHTNLLSANDLRLFMPLPTTGSVAIDDADTILDARALLHVLNVSAERRLPVILTARSAPGRWGVVLPDLVSRLRALAVVPLHPPDGELLRMLLRRLLVERQLLVSERLQSFMLLHLPRNGGAVREAVARLDRLALASGGRVTRLMAAMAVESPLALVRHTTAEEHDLLRTHRSA